MTKRFKMGVLNNFHRHTNSKSIKKKIHTSQIKQPDSNDPLPINPNSNNQLPDSNYQLPEPDSNFPFELVENKNPSLPINPFEPLQEKNQRLIDDFQKNVLKQKETHDKI